MGLLAFRFFINKSSMKKIVIVGCGRLSTIVADAIVSGILDEYDLVGVYSRTFAKADSLSSRMNKKGKSCRVCRDLNELLSLKPDFLVEYRLLQNQNALPSRPWCEGQSGVQ